MKTYSYKPSKVLKFLSHGKTQKHLTWLRNILAFSTISHPQAESRIQQDIFLHVISVRIIVSCYNQTKCSDTFVVQRMSFRSLLTNLSSLQFLVRLYKSKRFCQLPHFNEHSQYELSQSSFLKKSVNNFPCRTLSRNCKQHSKTGKNTCFHKLYF